MCRSPARVDDDLLTPVSVILWPSSRERVRSATWREWDHHTYRARRIVGGAHVAMRRPRAWQPNAGSCDLSFRNLSLFAIANASFAPERRNSLTWRPYSPQSIHMKKSHTFSNGIWLGFKEGDDERAMALSCSRTVPPLASVPSCGYGLAHGPGATVEPVPPEVSKAA